MLTLLILSTMIYLRNSKPIEFKRKRFRGDSKYHSLVNLIDLSPIKYLPKDKVRSNYLVRLNIIKPTHREDCQLDVKCKAIIQEKNHPTKIEQQKRRIATDRLIVKQIRKKSVCQKTETSKKQKSHFGFKKYFRHLNLQSRNDSALLGSSIIMQKREIKPLIKIRRSQNSYQNNQSSIQLSHNYTNHKFYRYKECQTERKQGLGPWEEIQEDTQQIRFINKKYE